MNKLSIVEDEETTVSFMAKCAGRKIPDFFGEISGRHGELNRGREKYYGTRKG